MSVKKVTPQQKIVDLEKRVRELKQKNARLEKQLNDRDEQISDMDNRTEGLSRANSSLGEQLKLANLNRDNLQREADRNEIRVDILQETIVEIAKGLA
jgi:predicted nuclease with TOPRIM domain